MCGMRSALVLVMLYVGLVHSWNIAIGNEDLLDFYVNKIKTNTVRFMSQNLGALAYDEVHDLILYVDKQGDNDAICGFNITSTHYKYLTERNGRNIHGIAFDPATELLFFTDTKERSINSISLKPGYKNNVYGNLLLKKDDDDGSIPTDIAVDSCRGYIYWINTNLPIPTIERAQFSGSYREVVIKSVKLSINSTYKLEPHSLAIDQQSQRIYWAEPFQLTSDYYFAVRSADLNGNNKTTEVNVDGKILFHPSNTLAVLKESIRMVGWCPDASAWLFEFLYSQEYRFHSVLKFPMKVPVSLVANYKVSDQIKGSPDCKSLTSLIENKSLINDAFKIATEYVEEFCVHGIQVDGLSPCKCSPGYIGERCDVSVCENYCLQGSCGFNDGGLPKCRCNAGYSGERCEVNLCHGYCQNDGDCSLKDKSEPVCECKENFAGVRCEVSACLHYCFQGNCSVNDEGLPKCRCNAGYSGERCEVNLCHGYCQNDGDCSLNYKSEPVCECKENFAGVRCEMSACLNYCFQGSCAVNDEGLPKCRCEVGYSGERCEVNLCHGYCLNAGECDINEEDELFCQCVDNYDGARCEAKNDNFTNTRTSFSVDRNLSLADLLSNWQKNHLKSDRY